MLFGRRHVDDEPPEDKTWELAGDNPAITVETQLPLRFEKEETQPHRRPTYLDEIKGFSD